MGIEILLGMYFPNIFLSILSFSTKKMNPLSPEGAKGIILGGVSTVHDTPKHTGEEYSENKK